VLLNDAGPEAPHNLANALKQLAGAHDLGQPIRDLGDALREGGNLASHLMTEAS
jgi:hypothetical protein